MDFLFLKFITIAALLSCVFGYALRQPQAEIVSQKTASLKPVADLDVSKFSGRWFEVYSSLLPQLSFTKDWVCVTANYKVRDQKSGVLDLFYNGRLGSASGPHYNITGTLMSDGTENGVFSIKYDPQMGRETYYMDDGLAGEVNNNKMASIDPLIERRERRIVKTHDAPDAKILDVTEEVQSLSVSALPIVTEKVKTVTSKPSSIADSVTSTASSVTDGKTDGVTEKVGDVTEKVKTVTSNPSSVSDSVTSTASSVTDGKTDAVTEKVGDVSEKVKTVTSNPTSVSDSVTSTASSVTDGKTDAVTEKVTTVADSTPLSGVTGVTEKVSGATEKVPEVTEKVSAVTDEVAEVSSEPTSAVEAVTESVSPLTSEPIEEEVLKATTTRPPRKAKGRASILNNNKISVLPINVKSKVEHKKQSITNILRSQPRIIRNDLTDLPANPSIQNDITSLPSSVTGSNLAYDGETNAQSGGIVNRVALFGDEPTTQKPLKSTAAPQKKSRAAILNNNRLSVLPINVQNDVSKRTQSITNIVSDVGTSAIQNDLTDIKETVPEIPTDVKEKVDEALTTEKEELAKIPTTNVATEVPTAEKEEMAETDVATEKLATENLPSKITSYAKTFAKNSKYVVVKLGPKTFGADNKYEYAVVTTPSRLSLGVLARDTKAFNEKYADEVFDFLKANEFDSLWNRPRPVLHEKNCEYPSAA